MKQAVGLRWNKMDHEPRVSPWAGMNQAVGLKDSGWHLIACLQNEEAIGLIRFLHLMLAVLNGHTHPEWLLRGGGGKKWGKVEKWKLALYRKRKSGKFILL